VKVLYIAMERSAVAIVWLIYAAIVFGELTIMVFSETFKHFTYVCLFVCLSVCLVALLLCFVVIFIFTCLLYANKEYTFKHLSYVNMD